jgi:maltooligosyltrehalose synthase
MARIGDHEGPPVLIAVARLTAGLVDAPSWPIGALWGDGALLLPEQAGTRWRDGWTGAELLAQDGRLALAEVFADLPVAILVGER